MQRIIMPAFLSKPLFICGFVLAVLPGIRALYAQSQGPASPDSVAYSGQGCMSCVGSEWMSCNEIKASDGQFSMTTLNSLSSCFQTNCYYSRNLLVSNFGFNIPSNATVLGITVEIQRSAMKSGVIRDSIVQLLKAGTPVGSNKALSSTWSTSNNYTIYGGPGDLWVTGWTPADINDPQFGVMLKVYNAGAGSMEMAHVDHLRMTVAYTGGTGVQAVTSETGGMNVYYDRLQRGIQLSFQLGDRTNNCTIRVYNMLGQLQTVRGLTGLANGLHRELLDVRKLQPGIYFVQLTTEKGTKTGKVIIPE